MSLGTAAQDRLIASLMPAICSNLLHYTAVLLGLQHPICPMLCSARSLCAPSTWHMGSIYLPSPALLVLNRMEMEAWGKNTAAKMIAFAHCVL